jgi:hypothetical protein
MSSQRIVSGRTTPGATNWQLYTGGGSGGVFVDVSVPAGLFSTTPVFVTSLGGNDSNWQTTSSIYNESPTGFRVYVRWIDGSPLTPATANGYKWHINWIAVEA